MSRGFASKSMLTSMMVGFETKSMLSPVGIPRITNSGGTNISITRAELEALISIQTLYTANLADKKYTNIPVNFTQYLKLREIANNAITKYNNIPALSILFQITVDGITGSINAYSLNTLNTETQIQNLYLQTTLQEVINGVNIAKAFHETSGTLSMHQTFQLAPLFRYYIRLYGVPEPGVGFDATKLALILTAMENSGIDPYN
jgi:hypothetical protein